MASTTLDSFFVSNVFARHNAAMSDPKRGHERAVVEMLRGWAAYADAYRSSFECGIGEDAVLGEPWAQIGVSILALLNGETGRLDCGTIDGAIRRILQAEGF